MKLNINKESTEKFSKDYGDTFSLNDFLECCKDGSFIDYDGFFAEILLNGNIICTDDVYPSEALKMKSYLLSLQDELGPLEIVWYNR